MPRRPSKNSKRGKSSKPGLINRKDSKIKKWNKLEDIPLDEEDQFHAARDKILLEGEGDVYEDEENEDEVFALKGMDVDSEEEEEEDYAMDEDDDQDEDEDEDEVPTKKGKGAKKAQPSSSSSSEDSEVDESWGRGKSAYYASNAAEIDSDDEEANELEEQEAIRLQRKAREALTEDDFGLNDIRDAQPTDDLHELADVVMPVAPALPKDDKQLMRHLEKANPEALALARDWADTAHKVAKAKARLEATDANDPDAQNETSLGLVHLYYQALLAYASTLAFYLHLRSGEKYAQRPELLRQHPIMGRLLTLKRGLATLEDLDFAPDSDNDGIGADSGEDDAIWDLARNSGLEPEELEELLNDAIMAQSSISPPSKPKTAEKPPKKKRKTTNADSKAVSQPIFDLEEPEFGTMTTTTRRRTDSDVVDTYGEPTSLQSSDAADKSARKKSLRFHTSKIESASARRQGARNQALGGDDDIPYKERKKQRELRLEKEAKARGLGQGGEDLDNIEPPPKANSTLDSDDEGSDDEGYYELVKQASRAKKEKKKAEYDAERAAERAALHEVESSEGPRALTRAILKNKGLTPHRSKSVRNPRVKKREKYEKAKKKVSSQKAVYKGGLAESGGYYGGEKSGISKVIKSVRLG
ncbi:hypothetical protein AX16_005405 [Volvariella volvacea WC 439]|nr:hypothetical protein AX16_005405 [Volvariella volvacea WC 439]